MKVSDFLKIENVISELKSDTKTDVLKELADKIASNSSNLSIEKTFYILQKRENLCSTALDEGVAIPHGKLQGISNTFLTFGRSKEGIDFDSLDSKPTHLFILIISPENSSKTHIQALAKMSNIFKNSEFRSNILNAKNVEEIYELIIDEDEPTK